jgi:hypothetical protein
MSQGMQTGIGKRTRIKFLDGRMKSSVAEIKGLELLRSSRSSAAAWKLGHAQELCIIDVRIAPFHRLANLEW